MYGRMLRTAEGWFKKASYVVIAIAPNNYFCLFAGASGMPIAGFLIANVTGTAVRLFLLRSFGNLFEEPLEAVRDFIADNRLLVFAHRHGGLRRVPVGRPALRRRGGGRPRARPRGLGQPREEEGG